MTIFELLHHAQNLSAKFKNVNCVEVDNTTDDTITITFKSEYGKKRYPDNSMLASIYNDTIAVQYIIRDNRVHIEMISNLSSNNRYSTLEYSGDELQHILERYI